MREQIAEYLRELTFSSRQELFDALNFIAPIIDGWGLAEPKSGHNIMSFTPSRVRANAYVEFSIPKKSGGERHISAPIAPLKAIQSALSILLQSIFTPSPYATGFIVGRSVKDNARHHLGQTCIFNADLENFFPSITKQMVRRALYRELGDILVSREVINIICSLCTVPGSDGVEVLPQGAPTSPVLSNIVLKSLDDEMSELALRIGCRYSRYADDITFSHDKPLRKMTQFVQSKIFAIIASHGLRVNEKKTRTLVPGTRQEVTGVVVNSKLNVSRKYIKHLRTLLHLWEKYGYEQARLIYERDFCRNTSKDLENVIRGKINYLEMIKGNDDSTYRRFKRRLKMLQWKQKHTYE